jgi:ABC-type dipeptide/oligopeptide/nickel transport system ATPase component
MKLTIPELAVVALVGPSGSGKSSFARKHFRPTEVLSSDFCRGLVSDEENSQAATNDAFEVLYFIASKRLTVGKLVVIDATNVQGEARKPIIALARQYHCIPVAIVFDLRKSFATSETVIVQTVLLVRTSYGNSLSNCAGLCGTLNGKAFAESMYCIRSKMLTPRKSSSD